MIKKLKKSLRKAGFYYDHRQIGPWGRLDKSEAEGHHFGFFGEFGYGIISWLPYLKYCAENGVQVNGVGPSGHRPIWSFANSFSPVDVAPGDSFGSADQIRVAQRQLTTGNKIIAPTNARRFGFSVGDFSWNNPWLHRSIDTGSYSPLAPSRARLSYQNSYVVLNFKNYFNWGNESIINFYNAYEIKHIADWAAANGLDLLLNRFPAPVEPTNVYADDADLMNKIEAYPNVQDLAMQYADVPDPAQQNEMQFALLSGAEHIFATQGGNAAIALVLGKGVSILMRGGSDYPDYTSMARIYGAHVDVAYEIEQFKVLGC